MKPGERGTAWLLFALLIGAWEIAAGQLGLSVLVLPPPGRVVQALWHGLTSGYLWPHVRATVVELLLGLVAGCTIGFVIGVLLAEVPALRNQLMPYVVVSQVVPKLALMPLFIVWFGIGLVPTVVITALICFFPLLETTLTGLTQVRPAQLELFRMLGATRWQTLLRLKLPSGLPAVLAGFRVAVVLALVGVVVGEFIAASQGLGALVIAAQSSMDTPLMFAVLALIALLGLLLYRIALGLERRLLRSYHPG